MKPRERARAIMLLLCLTVGAAQADAFDKSEERFFGLTNLWTFHLTFSASTWGALEPLRSAFPPGRDGEPRGPSPERSPAPGPDGLDTDYPWSTAAFSGAGETFTNVSIRFKGNSSFNISRSSLKRPFKLDFNRGAKSRTLLGHEELLLNNNVNDGTQFREALAYQLFRQAGLPAPRTGFARVYLTISGQRTNEFLGLYTVVEAVEADFLKAHFGTKKGLLLKPERVRGLEYLGPDWSAYAPRYEPKTSVRADDTQRFIALTRLSAEADDATFNRELPTRLDVSLFLRFIALNALLANYDSFLGTGHNYDVFQPSGTAPATFIPWDLNEAFGGHPGAGPRSQQLEFSVLDPQVSPHRLLDRVLANPAWAATYRRELNELLANVFTSERILSEALRITKMTQDAVSGESEFSRAAFQRSALGQTNVALPERRPGTQRPEGEGPSEQPGPPRPGNPDGGFRDDVSFADWVTQRIRNARAELTGERAGLTPQMQMHGPGGMRPDPFLPGNPNRPAPRPNRAP